MSLRIVDLDRDGDAWDATLATLDPAQRDVYFTGGYLRLAERAGARAMGAIFESGSARVLYPFLQRDLSSIDGLGPAWQGLSDIQTPYGYGGPLLGGTAGADAMRDFRARFSAWCRETGVVSEFVRFHPLLETHRFMAEHLDLVRVNTTVVCRLDVSPDERLALMGSSTRRGLRRALEAGLTASIETSDEAYDAFVALYHRTMTRLGAHPSYFFDRTYFADLRRLLGGSQALLCVRHDSRIVAAAVLLRSPSLVHYHLGASDVEALGMRPNNLLLHAAMETAWGAGAGALHLGGGVRDGDELFRFKAGFSPLRADFHVGRAIHLAAEYDRATRAREAHGHASSADYFPAYRAPRDGEQADAPD